MKIIGWREESASAQDPRQTWRKFKLWNRFSNGGTSCLLERSLWPWVQSPISGGLGPEQISSMSVAGSVA